MTVPDASAEIITRFAPSPTGYLHPGHAYSARLAHDFARARGGKFLLRIEDIDRGRCKVEFDRAILQDLAWIGLTWDGPVRRQSEHMADYRAALDRLDRTGLLYPCFCSRKDILREIEESGRAPHDLTESRPEGPLYPGTCRALSPEERRERIACNRPYALRLDMARALECVGGRKLIWHDLEAGEQIAAPDVLRGMLGDVVLARKDIRTSYHLAVVVDDHLQKISHVIRGMDLFSASHLHRLLQFLLGYETPRYLHHPLIPDEQGARYAKRDHSQTLRHWRRQGADPEELWRRIRPAGALAPDRI